MSAFFKTGKSKSTEPNDVKKLYEEVPQIAVIVNSADSKDVVGSSDLSKPTDLNKLHNIVENYGEIYLTNDDKLKLNYSLIIDLSQILLLESVVFYH